MEKSEEKGRGIRLSMRYTCMRLSKNIPKNTYFQDYQELNQYNIHHFHQDSRCDLLLLYQVWCRTHKTTLTQLLQLANRWHCTSRNFNVSPKGKGIFKYTTTVTPLENQYYSVSSKSPYKNLLKCTSNIFSSQVPGIQVSVEASSGSHAQSQLHRAPRVLSLA